MTKEQLIYDTGTVDLTYDDNGSLINVEGDGCVYSANGSRYRHIWHTNGKVKRKVAEFNQPIRLVYCRPSNALDFRVMIVGVENHPLEKLFSFESIDSIIVFYPIKDGMIESMLSKLPS